MMKSLWSGPLLAAAAATACTGGGGAGPELPTTPPTRVTLVASSGFHAPTDAVASPDGRTFYFAAFADAAGEDEEPAAIFRVDASGGEPEAIARAAPLRYPGGLVLSADGATLFIADVGAFDEGDEAGALYTLDVDGGAPARLTATGLRMPRGLALGVDGSTLYVTGRTEDGRPGVFTLPAAGGAASLLYAGDPLVSPTGLHVDDASVAWVMDHLGGAGETGALFAIDRDGNLSVVVDGLSLGEPGGVSLVAGGGTAVIPSRAADGAGQLMAVEIATGEVTILPAPTMVEPAGTRTAREAGVLVVVDSEGNGIYRAE
jgi:DNA-binding beta-propeller fold protein YncE